MGRRKTGCGEGLIDREEKMLPENVSRSGDKDLVPSVSFPWSESVWRVLPHGFFSRTF